MESALVTDIKKLRTKLNLSKEGMANILHVSDSYIAMIENGERRPGVKFLGALAFHFPELDFSILSYLKHTCSNGHSNDEC